MDIVSGVAGFLGAWIGVAAQRWLEGRRKREEARWTRWDEGRAKAVQHVNEHLALLGQACSRAFEECDNPELLAKGLEAWRAFIHAVNVQGIFLDDDLLKRLHDVHDQAWTLLNSLRIRQDQTTPLLRKGEVIMEAYQALEGLYAPLRGELRRRFQSVLRDASVDASPLALPPSKSERT